MSGFAFSSSSDLSDFGLLVEYDTLGAHVCVGREGLEHGEKLFKYGAKVALWKELGLGVSK